jgi:membrane protein implicated in regulation of membrane protease activity
MIPELASPAPLWLWLVIAAGLLAVEVATGTGWLLWATGAAAVVGLASLALRMSFAVELIVFAVLTIAGALLAKRFFPRLGAAEPDINDNVARIVGRRGDAASAFRGGAGRVRIDGKEWAAELQGRKTLTAGSPVEVTGVEGARLTVRALPQEETQ